MELLWLALFFIVLGVCIKYGKMYFLIAGYNTLSKEKKATYDIEKIASVFRNGMFGMSAILILGQVLNFYVGLSKDITFSCAMTVGFPYILIRSNSSKFRR